MTDTEPKILKRLPPWMAFVWLLLPILGGGAVWLWDKYGEYTKDKKIESLQEQVEQLRVAQANAVSDTKQCETIQAQQSAVLAQKDRYIDTNLGKVDGLWITYAKLLESVRNYEATLSEPTRDEQQRRFHNEELARRVNALVDFVKRWRATLPYLCGLLGGDNDALEDLVRRRDGPGIIRVVDRLHDGMENQRNVLKTVIEQSKTKSLVDLPCLCSHQ